MKYFILATLVLASCGQQPASTPTETPVEGGEIERQPEEKEIVTEYRKDGEDYALSLESTSDLPVCEMANDRQLAYVKDEDTFFSCEKDTWVEIDTRGPQGDKGEKGDKGEPGMTVTGNMWLDAVTGKYWLISAPATYAQIEFTGVCGNGWKLPSRSEALNAALHGLGVASGQISGPTTAWTSNAVLSNPTTHAYAIQLTGTVLEMEKPKSESHGILCIQE